METARFQHTATRLRDSQVLIAGGNSDVGVFTSAEVYNPRTGSFHRVGEMNVPRLYHTATLLRDGRVLIVGGLDSSAELYDPTTETFSTTGSFAEPKLHHAAALLSNGKVLITGAIGAPPLAGTAELYDPHTGVFTAAGEMPFAHYLHTATTLRTGRVLVCGGSGSGGFADVRANAEVYYPTTRSFAPIGDMINARRSHSATMLLDGSVLIAGGDGGEDNYLATAEVYDPITSSFSATGSMSTSRYFHTATRLRTGRVLMVGGSAFFGHSGLLSSAEIYDPKSATFTTIDDMSTKRRNHTATLLRDGRVLLVGGSAQFGADFLASAELFSESNSNSANGESKRDKDGEADDEQ